MEHKFCTIQIMPSSIRGERVNVGLIVSGPDGVDVRVSRRSQRKIKAIAAGESNLDIVRIGEILRKRLSYAEDFKQAVTIVGHLSSIICAEEGAFYAHNRDEYKERINELMSMLVDRPRRGRSFTRSPKLHTEIRQSLKRLGIFSAKSEDISRHKIIEGYEINGNASAKADFAGINSAYHYIKAVDLNGRGQGGRSEFASIQSATLILNFGRNHAQGDAICYLVVGCAEGNKSGYAPALEMAREYSVDVVNYYDDLQKSRFLQSLKSAFSGEDSMYPEIR